jgi:hypothetical protein
MTENNEKALAEWLARAKTDAEREIIRRRFPNVNASVSDKPTNRATGRISNQRFPDFDMDLIAPVWLAYASSTFFETTSNRSNIPKCILAMVATEYALVSDPSELTTSGKKPDLPCRLTVYEKTSAAGDSAASATGAPFIRFEYEVESWTKLDGLILPQRSKLRAFKFGTADTLYEVEIVNQSAHGNLKEPPAFQPRIPVQTYISDARFKSESGGKLISYQVQPPTSWPVKEVVRGSTEFKRMLSTAKR